MDIIQNCKVAPSTPYAIGIIDGDGGHPMTKGSEQLYYGTTYEEVFRSRMVDGTFSGSPMPDHGFLVLLTAWQIKNSPGKDWADILMDEGFEFIRTVDNSVYSGSGLAEGEKTTSAHENYLFGCFRNIGSGGVADQLKLPKGWKATVPQAVDYLSVEDAADLKAKQEAYHLEKYVANKKKAKKYTLSELYAKGLTDDQIHMPGTQMRGQITNPRYQESRSERIRLGLIKKPTDKSVKADPFAVTAVA